MIDDVNIFLEILRNVVLDKSIIVVGAPGAESQNLQISVISSIVNSIKLLIYPLQWVQTCITILPFELIDILEAPMPYIVGILYDHWNYFQEGAQDDFLMDKCLIRINSNNTLTI